MVATPGQVEGVLFGEDPAAPAPAPGTVVLVMATVGPAAVQRLDRGERMVHGSDETKSALDIFVKDMGLVLDAARGSSYPAPLASTAAQLYLAGRRAGLGRRDDSTVIEILRGGPSPA
jgi:3-hydroxyisobutyrate dehydrogenase-like beta-hydroxyacid dehydrogenase